MVLVLTETSEECFEFASSAPELNPSFIALKLDVNLVYFYLLNVGSTHLGLKEELFIKLL